MAAGKPTIGIGQHRAVGMGGGLGAALIVIGEGNGVAVAYKLFAGCTLVDANRDSPAKEIIQTCHYR